MKKGKKILSAILAVLMVMYCFMQAHPNKVGATDSYNVEVIWNASDTDVSDAVSFDYDDDGSCIGFAIDYMRQDGSTGRHMIDLAGEQCGVDITRSIDLSGYPIKLYAIIDAGNILEEDTLEIKSMSVNGSIIFNGVLQCKSSTNYKLASIDYLGNFESNDTDWAILAKENTATWKLQEISGELFPSGYNFDEDSYNFENFIGWISEDYYTTMFGVEKGTELHKFRGSYKGGHCYGMAITTAATLIGAPEATDYIKWNLDYHQNLKSVNKGSISGTMGISAKDYIKYGHIYQDSVAGVISRNTNQNNITALKAAVSDYVYGNGLPVMIDLLGGDGNHTVLAVGIDGEDILVNDSNVVSGYRKIDFNGSNWSYSAAGFSWNNTNTTLSFSTDVITPYLRIVARVYVAGANVPEDESSEISGAREIYATGMAVVDEDKLLIVDEKDSYTFNENDTIFSLDGYSSGEANSYSEASLYWLSEGTVINANNTSGNNATLKLVGDELKISACLPENSTVTMEIDENGNNGINIRTEESADVVVTFTTIDTEGELLDVDISGTADGSEITATQKETGILITGISDGTVTLSKNEVVIAVQEITEASSDIEIVYDKTGKSEEVELNYEQYHSHFDEDDDGKCDDCGEITEQKKECKCLCHANSFFKFIYMVISWIASLFGINGYCDCGANHY